MAQTIEAFVGTALDEAKISPLHRRVIGLIAAGYFFDVIDFTILGSLIPYIIKSGFTSPAEAAAIGAQLAACAKEDIPPLAAAYGPAEIDKAVLDALLRGAGVNFFDGMVQNIAGVDARLRNVRSCVTESPLR